MFANLCIRKIHDHLLSAHNDCQRLKRNKLERDFNDFAHIQCNAKLC